MEQIEIEKMLHSVLGQMPDRTVEMVRGRGETTHHANMVFNIPRYAFHLKTLLNELGRGAKVADVGGGINLLGVGARELGIDYHLIDDFSDRWHDQTSDFLEEEKRRGVQVISLNIMEQPFPFSEGTLDGVMTFDMLEHLHSSPRPLLHAMVHALRPGGVLFIGVPNSANLRKRLAAPIGKAKWSPMTEWYDEPVFRGHVREPDVDDLRYIARDLGLRDVQIMGRNWLGYSNKHSHLKAVMPLVDKGLRPFPALCSDIYLLGRK